MRSYKKTLLLAALAGVMTAGISIIMAPSVPQSCRDLHEKMQQLTYNDSGLASTFATMPEELVEKAINERYAGATDQQCAALLPEINQGLTAVSRTPWAPHMTQAGEAATAAVITCRDKRVNGELKTHEDSAKCSAPGVAAAFNAIHYPYMDLVTKFTDKRQEEAAKIDKALMPGQEDQTGFAKLAVEVADEERQRVTAGKP